MVHDAFGRVVEYGGTQEFLYLPSGAKIAELNGQTLNTAWVPLPGGSIADYNSSGVHDYAFADWLGSARLSSTPTRTLNWDAAFAPFGEVYVGSGGSSMNFTGNFTALGSNMWDFQLREEHSSQGRWISPDPAGLAAVDPANPQSWNRYAYVGANPLSDVDPLGLTCSGERLDSHGSTRTCDSGTGGGGTGGWAGDSSEEQSVIDAMGWTYAMELPGYFENSGTQFSEWRFDTTIATGIDPVTGQSDTTGYAFVGGANTPQEKQRELAALQLGQAACAGQSSSAIAGCIIDAYNTMGSQCKMVGGNCNFSYTGITIEGSLFDPSNLDCFQSRCGIFDSLHFHTSGDLAGYFHVDTANPYFLPFGSIVHLTADLIGGNTWWSAGIPRNPGP